MLDAPWAGTVAIPTRSKECFQAGWDPADNGITAPDHTHQMTRFRVPMLLLLAALLAPAPPAGAGLASIADALERRHESIGHVAPAVLAQWRAAGRDIVLLDVRSEEEYRVGRLRGAIRLPPDAASDQVLEAIERSLDGATVVAYCSVGHRSSVLASRAHEALLEAGAAGVWNLRGGIFAWHNQARPLADAAGPTQRVHPYSARWGRYLERSGHAATEPAE